MRISLRGIAEVLGMDFETQLKPHLSELRTKLPLSGLEVGAVEKPGEALKDVIVAQVKSTKAHPNADRLKVCEVETGSETLQIVCGAPNVKAGMKVALAPVDCVLPGSLKIKKSAIRGVESSGMLCSAKELALSSESDGLMDLNPSAPLGTSLVKALGLDDEIWEIELTPDRGDCLSHRGMAREVGRFFGAKVQDPELEALSVSDKGEVPLVRVDNQAPKACLSYSALLFEDITNSTSPDWLKRRLELLGLRPKTAAVDITNWVLMELGQPLHAFDADHVVGQKIVVRFAKTGEKLKTLDGVDRELSSEDLVIADIERPLALAGVMGGLDSAVTESTRRVILECAVFDPLVIRSAVARHKLPTDSSVRFERGVDAAYRRKAMGRASLLLKQLCSARRRGSLVEVGNSERQERSNLNLDLRRFHSVVGIDLSPEELARALEATGVSCTVKSANVLKVEIPSHRHDLSREIDWIEEGARLLGYDRIPARYPLNRELPSSGTRGVFERVQFVRHRLLELGLAEMMPYSFNRSDDARWTPSAKIVRLANPLSAEFAHLRPNLAMGLLDVLKRHSALGQDRVEVFDVGNCFELRDGAAESERSTGVKEPLHAAWALMGPREVAHWSTDKASKDRKLAFGFFESKGIASGLMEALLTLEGRWASTQWVRLDDWQKRPEAQSLQKLAPWIPETLLHPFRSAVLFWPGSIPKIVGYVGELHPSFKTELLNLATGRQPGVAFGELRIWESFEGEVVASQQRNNGLAGFNMGKVLLSRPMPRVERDLAMVVDPARTKAEDLEKTLFKAGGADLVDLECLDVYPMGPNEVSLAFRAVFQGQEATLTDAEVSQKIEAMIQAAKTQCGASLRG
jgi:phenylalanyl-tRNA synthetase beta chain